MIEVLQTEVFEKWFSKLRVEGAKVRILNRMDRMGLGNPGDVRSVGDGVHEMRIFTVPAIGYISFIAKMGPLSYCSVVATKTHKTVT